MLIRDPTRLAGRVSNKLSANLELGPAIFEHTSYQYLESLLIKLLPWDNEGSNLH